MPSTWLRHGFVIVHNNTSRARQIRHESVASFSFTGQRRNVGVPKPTKQESEPRARKQQDRARTRSRATCQRGRRRTAKTDPRQSSLCCRPARWSGLQSAPRRQWAAPCLLVQRSVSARQRSRLRRVPRDDWQAKQGPPKREPQVNRRSQNSHGRSGCGLSKKSTEGGSSPHEGT
jgi:hypothetical protein